MPDNVETLVLDLLEWIGPGPRAYAEVLDAWRTSCPSLPVWEEATERGLIVRDSAPSTGSTVSVTRLGETFLRERRATSTAAPSEGK